MKRLTVRLPFWAGVLFLTGPAMVLFGMAVCGQSADVTPNEVMESSAAGPDVTMSPTKLLRYPDIYENEIVFAYGCDLWKASTDGGEAVRLTAHEGQEMFPKFSPDGKWIAFTGQYDGDEQVYIIPAEGGIPKQLTYYPVPGPTPPRRGVEHQVLGWTPDSQRVLFRSGMDSNGVDALTHIYSVSIEGGIPEKLPMPVAGAGDMSLDGNQIVYSPLFRDFRHWKRYEGGWAQYLLIYNQQTGEYKPIPTTPRTDRDPMWVDGTVYFVSDRNGTMNLYRYVADTNLVEQCTNHSDWDVRWASSDGKNQIVYELAGTLRLFDPASGEERELVINVPHDGLAMRPRQVNVADKMESFDLAPQGKRAVFVARGEVFTAPVEKGNVRNLTKTSGIHERAAVWSPDGQWIAYISDQSGEDQIYLIDQAGKEAAIPLTHSLNRALCNLVWAPDNKTLAFCDATRKLYCLDIKFDESGKKPVSGELVQVDQEENGAFPEPVWSPCSQYLAYTKSSEVSYNAVYIWDRKTKEVHQITDSMFDSTSPAWSPNGDWLYYISQREFYPQFSNIEWNFAGNRFQGIFAVPLRSDVENSFAPQSDEVEIRENDEAKPDSDEAKEQNTADNSDSGEEKTDTPKDEKNKTIDFTGMEARTVRIPVASDNYEGLSAAGDFLFYFKSSAPYYGREPESPTRLQSFDLKKLKEQTFLDDVSGYAVSPDGTKLMTRQGNSYKLYDVAAAAGEAKNIATDGLVMNLVPSEEWNEVFNEVWRRYRDYFYVANMHGVDWEGIGNQYRSLLPYVAHRCDLTYILTEMIAELNVGHSYVEGGDYVVPERPQSGLAGAVFALDKENNRYRIVKIYQGQNEEPKYRSPLTEFGIKAAEGDYVLAIDGEKLLGTDNPYRLLQNKKGAVTWTLSKSADGQDSWDITYKPITNEANLRYLNTVLDRMERVRKASDGRIGYFHVPDMGGNGAYEFIKWYYPQIRKEGIIVDDRNNGGGNISSWIIMRLNQKLLGTRFGMESQSPSTYPTIACNAHLICLINETSASDGDIFPYYFRKSGLGPIIGKRSWGGVVGISSRGPLVDGGTVYVPLSATNDENGEYIIEGHGVDPDIEVAQDPKAMMEGGDPQLDRAIQEMLKKINDEPRKLPGRPADPVKDKAHVRDYTKAE